MHFKEGGVLVMNKIRPYAFFPPFILLIIVAVYSLTIGMQDEAQTVKVKNLS